MAPSGCPTASGSSRATSRPATCCRWPTTTRGWSRRTPSATTRSTPTPTQIRTVAKDLGLGRIRTLSPEGHELAAQRWYDGDAGPEGPLAQSAPEPCSTCGFLVRISGSLAESFGVCANGDANDDGRVVAFSHGCGAHSEVRLAKRHEPQPMPDPVIDELDDDLETF